MCTSLDSFVHVALHQSQILQALSHQTAYTIMYVPPACARMCVSQGKVVTVYDNIIDFLLFCSEFTWDRSGTCVVRAVVFACFCSGVAKKQTTCFQGTSWGITMQYFAVHWYDALERRHSAQTWCDTIQHTADVSFGHTRATQTHRCSVHFVTNLSRAFHLFDFFSAFLQAQFYDSINQLLRSSRTLCTMVDTEQVGDGEHRFVAIGRQEVDSATCRLGTIKQFAECCHRCSLCYATLLGHLYHTGHFAIPYDIINIYLVAEEGLFARISINHTNETIAVLTEEIEETAILAKLVSIGRIVHRTIIVAKEHNETVAYQLA